MIEWLCGTGEIYSLYLDQKSIATTPVGNLPIKIRNILPYWRDLYYKWKNNALRGEEINITASQVNLLNCQHPDFPRYAFYMEILPPDPEQSLVNRMRAEFAFLMEWTQVIFDHTWPGAVEGKNYLMTTLGMAENSAWHWLRVITITYMKRYAFDVASIDALVFINRADVLRLYPDAICIHGELPERFITSVGYKFPLEGMEFQDKLDEVCFKALSPVRLNEYIEWAYAEQAARAARWRRFRTYFIIAMAAIVFLPVIIKATVATYAALQSPTVKTMSLLSKMGLAIETFATSIKTSISVFLTAIQFDTMLSVHKIAFLVSEDYRLTMRKVYGEISKVSSALGYGPYFMALFLQNARSIVLNTSTAIGMKYDLAQVQWLSGLHEYLRLFSAATYKYRDNPEALFFDLERWVERPTLDAKGEMMQGVLLTLRNTTEAVETLVNNVVGIRDELSNLVAKLPSFIRKEIEPYTKPILAKIDDFITKNYDPYRKQLDSIIDVLEDRQITAADNMAGLINRLKKPANYLLEIDQLEGWEREEQERKVSDIATRQLDRDTKELYPHTEAVSAELERIRKALEYVTLEPLYLPVEVEGPGRPAGVPAKERETWYIGDY